jgi:hypothetical protein
VLQPEDIEKRYERSSAGTFLLEEDNSAGECCHAILLNYHIEDNGREGEVKTLLEGGDKYKHLKKILSIIPK